MKVGDALDLLRHLTALAITQNIKYKSTTNGIMHYVTVVSLVESVRFSCLLDLEIYYLIWSYYLMPLYSFYEDHNIFFKFLGCLTCCAPPISNCILADKLDLDKDYKYVSFIDYLGFICIFSSISAMRMRKVVRKDNNIPGSRFEDGISSFFCLPCVICQMQNQVDRN